jgi:regulator of protease activity HflC (stomatin/prohibitin superfamily)
VVSNSALGKALAVGLALAVATGFIAVIFSYEQVGEGHVGVEKEWGAVTGAVHPAGPNWVAPWVGVQNVEIRPRTYTSSVDVTTLNGTTFNVSYVIRYRVVDSRAAEFVKQWNQIEQAEQRLIDPTVEDRMRKEGAGIRSSVIYTEDGRNMLATAAQEKLSEAFDGEALVLEAVQITNVGIPGNYQRALNEKEIAKQNVQKEKYNVEKQRQIARQKEIDAEADARVIEITGEALRANPIVLQQREIDAIKPTDKVIIGSGNGGIIIDANTDGSGAQTSNWTATG